VTRDEQHEDFAWPTAEEAVAEAKRARHTPGEGAARASFDERRAAAALYPRTGRVAVSPQHCPIHEKQPAALTRPGCVTEP
jgi:hypothetical protein